MLTTRTAAGDLRAHLPTVLVGLHWLYDTPQPDDAVLVDGAGQTLASAGGWRFTFVPANPSGTPSIVVDPAASLHPLSQRDIDELAEHVDDFGEPVRRAYLSGARGILELHSKAHPSLLSAVARTRDSQRRPAATNGQSDAVHLADLRQQTLARSPAPRLVAEPGTLWPAQLGASGRALTPRPNATAVMWARASKAPPSLRLRCRNERPRP